MARGNGQRGGDRILESRHLVGLFLGVVLLCGVFFTLGYVMGKTQYGGAVHAATAIERTVAAARPSPKPADSDAAPAAAPAPAPGEWDFYTKKSNADHLQPAPKASGPVESPTPSGSTIKTAAPAAGAQTTPASAHLEPPRMTKGSVVLQVAALRHQSDALAMADVLQQKRFPAFVVTPTNDGWYRVQVGPYPDERAADSAKAKLERAGFKAIVKR
jgi:DedD protein